MTTMSVTPLTPHEVEINLAYQHLKTHAWINFQYILNQNDIRELIFSDMWGSLEEFIDYMGQSGVNIGAPIQGTANYTPPSTAQLFSGEEIEAMGGAILPLNYGLYSGSIDQRLDLFDRQSSLENLHDRDSNAQTIFTDYSSEKLPLYDGVKLPPYRSHIGDIEAPITDSPEYIESPLPNIVPSSKGSRRIEPFSKLRSRISAKVRSLRDKLHSHKKKESTAEQPDLNVSGDTSGGQAHGVLRFPHKLRDLSPKRVARRARDFIACRA